MSRTCLHKRHFRPLRASQQAQAAGPLLLELFNGSRLLGSAVLEVPMGVYNVGKVHEFKLPLLLLEDDKPAPASKKKKKGLFSSFRGVTAKTLNLTAKPAGSRPENRAARIAALQREAGGKGQGNGDCVVVQVMWQRSGEDGGKDAAQDRQRGVAAMEHFMGRLGRQAVEAIAGGKRRDKKREKKGKGENKQLRPAPARSFP